MTKLKTTKRKSTQSDFTAKSSQVARPTLYGSVDPIVSQPTYNLDCFYDCYIAAAQICTILCGLQRITTTNLIEIYKIIDIIS